MRMRALREPDVPHETRVFRRLPGARCPHGYDARWCSGHGLGSLASRCELVLPAALDLRALGGCRDHGPRLDHHSAEQNRHHH